MKIFSQVKEYIYIHKISFIIYILLCLILGILNIILPLINGKFIDTLLISRTANVVLYFCCILLLVFLTKLIVGYFVRILYAKLQINCAYEFNFKIIKHIQKLPYNKIENMDMLYLNKIVNNDTNALIIYALSVLQEFIIFCHIFSFFSEMHNRLNNYFQKLKKLTIKSQKISYFFEGIEDTIYMTCQIFVFYYGGVQIIHGNFTFGMFTIYSSYVSMILSSLKYFFEFGKKYQETMGAHDRIEQLLRMEEKKNGNKQLQSIHAIKLLDVSFSYDKKVILKELNYTFSKGYIYGIIGENGVGKSTLLNLITGIYEADSGHILYDNDDIRTIDLLHIRKYLFTVVPQSIDLLDDNIFNNVVLTPNFDDKFKDRLKEIIKILNFEKGFQNKYSDINIKINEHDISKGEQQKIALLRALLKDPDVIILDEPTTALDQITTTNLLQYLKSKKKNKIIIIITHDDRITSIFDSILKL